VEAILRIALSNTLLAAMLALTALAISRTFRRPALSHALWLIVLLKLITPPLWNVALPLMPVEKKPPLPPTELSMPVPESAPIQRAEVNLEPVERWAAPTLQATDVEISEDSKTHSIASIPYVSPPQPRLTWSQRLVAAWAAGSALCILIIVLRVRQFTRLLEFAEPAEARVQMSARALSARVKIQKCPRVWFVPGPVCPMLWAFGGKARLLIPAGLWDRLDEGQRSTLLLHELAHYRRGDHWIRVLELLITILFWWNPIAWWARHELREAEEQCCDAWVIWTLPRAARDYAIALMEAIDFVSTTRRAVPVLASPMGEFHDLKRRLLMIKQNNAPKALGWTGFSLMCLLAALLLPLSATLAQQLEKPQPAGLPPVEPVAELPATTPPPIVVDISTGLAVTGGADADPNAAAAHREARALEEELKITSAEIAKLTERLHAAQARLMELHKATARALPMEGAAGMPGQPAPMATRGRLTRTPTANRNGMDGTMGAPTNADQEQRLRTVEQKLDLLIQELREMRKERPDRPQNDPEFGRGGGGFGRGFGERR
jgi:beta-lactamase regulating signal transducer with metallopeptidase domain